MAEHSSNPPLRLLDAVRDAYLRRRTGRLEPASGGPEIYLRDGELYFDRDSDLVAGLSPVISSSARLQRPMADEAMRRAVEDLASRLLSSVGGAEATVEWSERAPLGVELVGPLPAVGLLLAAAVHGGDEATLLARLGGEDCRFTSRDETPAMGQLPGLDDDMARVLVLLDQPTSVKAMLRGGGDRRATLTGLVRLWAIGLAEKPDGSGASHEACESSVVDAKMLARFLDRIGENLDDDPGDVDPKRHRGRLADLVAHFGELDHYQLLGVEMTADDAEISSAYDRLARLAHPRHAAAIGWSGKEGTLRLLFERATEAYLTLADPLRRSSYNNLVGRHREVEVDATTRDGEKRFVARQNFLQAGSSLAEADYSTAVDLLKESVRIDPKPEYFAMLGQAQAKNPNWRHHAALAYGRAVELDPDNAGYHLAFAKLLEKIDRAGEAKSHFEAAVDLMPDNVDALEGVRRLGGAAGGRQATRSLRSVLGRRR